MAPASHYYDPSPGAARRPHTVTMTLPDMTVNLMRDTAVFSGDRVDPGTKYLLLEAPAPPAEGTFVDLGCGYGPIAVALARRSPGADVYAVDVNERAIELAAANLEPYANARATAPPDDAPLDRIYSNPPIRIGKDELRRLLAAWLPRLAPDGAAYLVVHKHLGSDSLAGWLGEEGWTVCRLGSRLGYRILEVRP